MAIRNSLSCWSASCLSSTWWARLHRTQYWSVLPELSHDGAAGGLRVLLGRALRGHQSVCHPCQVCHPSCPKTSSWHAASEANGLRPYWILAMCYYQSKGSF
jgi:hypothetical protein